jgi:hypothetical protein
MRSPKTHAASWSTTIETTTGARFSVGFVVRTGDEEAEVEALAGAPEGVARTDDGALGAS